LLIRSSPLLLTLLEPCVREQGAVSTFSPLSIVLAAYQHLASRYPAPEDSSNNSNNNNDIDGERMVCDCMTEAEQLYEDSYDGSSVRI